MKRATETKVYRYSNIAYIIDALARGEMVLLDPSSWEDKNDSQYIDLYRQYREVAGVFASCCTLSRETFHHWYIFGGSSAGAFIEYDRAELEACLEGLKSGGHKLRYKPVKYLTLENVEKSTASLKNFPFLKRFGFQSEKEYRVIVETDDETMTSYPIPIPIDVIRRIVINPWLPKSVVSSLRERIRSIPGCDRLSVDHSRLIKSDRWIAAGIKKLTGHIRSKRPAYKKLRKKKAK